MRAFPFDFYKQSADYLLERIAERPEIALVLGSGLGSLANELEHPIVVPYHEIPNFLTSSVKSHAGKLIFGRLSGKRVVCMAGRFHSYEGYDFEELAAPIRVLHLLGAEKVILTNAAGAINTEFSVGDIMVITDHIKLAGHSPLRGPNVDEFGARFFDVTEMYTPALCEIALRCATATNQADRTRQGIYFFMGGPQFETPAEIRAIRTLGGDAVGMSTVTEALTAAHCGMQVLGLSLMTNMAAGVLPQKLSDEEVVIAARDASARFQTLLRAIVKEM